MKYVLSVEGRYQIDISMTQLGHFRQKQFSLLKYRFSITTFDKTTMDFFLNYVNNFIFVSEVNYGTNWK